MKFLIDAHHLGRRQTGNETWTRNVVRALEDDQSIEPEPADVTYAVTAAGVDHLPKSVLGDRRFLVSSRSAKRLAWDLPRVMRRVQVDAAMMQYTAPLSRVPIVLMVHDLSFEDVLSKDILPLHARLRYRTTVRASVRRAARVLVPSQFTMSTLLERYPVSPDRISVAPPAVDPELLGLMNRLPREPGAKQRTILCVGGLVPRKNIEVVARAVKLLRERDDVRLQVVGPIPREGGPIKRIIRELLGGAVTFTGHVDMETLARSYRSADVFCFPTIYEGFGIPLLEAMAADLPVVCANSTALPEVAGEAAIYVDPEDVAAWVRAIEEALTPGVDSARRYSAAADRLRYYSWERTGSVVLDALRGVAG